MFVTGEDFEDWQEEQTILDELTHILDFEAWERELAGMTERN